MFASKPIHHGNAAIPVGQAQVAQDKVGPADPRLCDGFVASFDGDDFAAPLREQALDRVSGGRLVIHDQHAAPAQVRSENDSYRLFGGSNRTLKRFTIASPRPKHLVSPPRRGPAW